MKGSNAQLCNYNWRIGNEVNNKKFEWVSKMIVHFPKR